MSDEQDEARLNIALAVAGDVLGPVLEEAHDAITKIVAIREILADLHAKLPTDDHTVAWDALLAINKALRT